MKPHGKLHKCFGSPLWGWNASPDQLSRGDAQEAATVAFCENTKQTQQQLSSAESSWLLKGTLIFSHLYKEHQAPQRISLSSAFILGDCCSSRASSEEEILEMYVVMETLAKKDIYVCHYSMPTCALFHPTGTRYGFSTKNPF